MPDIEGRLISRTLSGASAGVLNVAVIAMVSRVISGVGAGTLAVAFTGARAGAGTGAFTSAFAGAGVMLATLSNSKIISDNLLTNGGLVWAPAITFALVNSLSNYAIYGYPLEESLSETARIQWQKFFAPLNYLSTLFHWQAQPVARDTVLSQQ